MFRFYLGQPMQKIASLIINYAMHIEIDQDEIAIIAMEESLHDI